MGVRSWIVNKLAGDIIENKVNGALNVFRYEVPGKEIMLPRLAIFRQQEYKLWAEGNPADLIKFYGTYSIVPGEMDSNSRQLFWEWVRGVNNVPKLHYPAPEIIMNQMKSLIFADDLDINVIKENDKGEETETESKELTETLKKILKENDHNEKYQTGSMMETYSGSLSFRPVYNEDVSEYPIIIPYPAEKIKLRSTLGKIYEVIYEDDYSFNKKRYRLKSHYGKGYIKYHLWECDDSGNEKKEVDIKTVPELEEGYTDIIITMDGKPIDLLLAPFKKNRTKSNEFMDTEYGGSDFQGITDTFHMIDELYSQKNLYIRRARPMITMSQRFLKKDKDGNEIIPKEYEQDTIITRGDEATNNLNKPERDLPELNLAPYDQSIKEELKNAWLKIGMSYTTVGLEANSANISGAALEIKERSSIIVRSNKIKLWDSFLQYTYRILLIFNSLKDVIPTYQDDGTIVYAINDTFDYTYQIEFPVYNNQTFNERLDEAIKARNGGILDTKSAVDHALRDSYSKEEKEEIVKNSKIENGTPLIGDEFGNP